VQRIRLRYFKQGPARFASQQDFARAFERALRRAEVPMAYSSGFSPHPRISYTNAVPTGVASLAEYLEIGLSGRVDPEAVRTSLNQALPGGFQIMAAVEAAGPALAESLTHSAWHIELGVDATAGVADFLAADAVVVQRMGKSGLRELDIREAIVALEADTATLSLRAVTGPGQVVVRPSDIVAGLAVASPALRVPGTALAVRLAQGIWVDGRVRDPFGPDRQVDAAANAGIVANL
jgi:radical SAM-linked protein